MRNWTIKLPVFLAVLASTAFGQVGNGSITGTITDPAGAVIVGASVEAKNVETGVAYPAVSTNTGNYTIPDLPVGTYNLTVTSKGFKTYTHTNLALAATQVLRQDVPLEVGAAAESVTVTAEASLLATDTGGQTTNVTISQLDDVPVLGIGTVNSGTSGYRNPYNVIQTLPGASGYSAGGLFTMNGLGGATTPQTTVIEGEDATSRIFGSYEYTQMAQPGVDSIQEIAFQTSNYAAEFGQAGSVVVNMTMKSGTNQYHGSIYDNFVNEDLNAGDPFSVSGGPGSDVGGSGGKYQPRNRRNDFGGTLGGPIIIPKIYDGHNKTFFFWSYEEYLESNTYSYTDTVPTPAYLNGDFSAISANGNCSLCATYGVQSTALGIPTPTVDALNRPMFANEIYDPLTRGFNNGAGYANPFPNNQIPLNRFDPVSIKFQNLFPKAQNANLTGNYAGIIGGNRYSAIPSMKIDENISDKDKLSFYYSENNTESQVSAPYGNADGLPPEIGGYRGTFIPTYTERLNYDRTIRPTLLLHLGGGYLHTSFSDRAPFLNFDPSQFGLSGFLIHRQFPSVTGMCVTPPGFGAIGCGGEGGMQNIGTAGQIQGLNYEEKPSFSGSLTWIHGNHTYKLGTSVYLEQTYTGSFAGVTLNTGTNATAQPFVPDVSLGGFSQGFGYASFLLGDYGGYSGFPPTLSSTTQTPQENYRMGQQQWALYLQDSWKVTHKLTLDYGLRWDVATPQHEQYDRLGQLDMTAPNANAGGHPGATLYANTCHCQFYQPTYPYAIGPRLGVAYQIDPKTVFRAGWGIVYNFIGNPAGAAVSTNGIYPLSGTAINPYVNIETPGVIVPPTWPVTDPSVYPAAPGIIGAPGSPFAPGSDPFMADANENRPPRINQWTIGFQREITRNFVLEANYVANRAAWLAGPYGFLSQTPASQYAKFGLYPYPGTGPCSTGGGVCASTTYNNDADRNLLNQPIFLPSVVQAMSARGITNLLPYAGFPTSSTLQGILYPFPQFGALEPSNSATGNSKYDSLQIKATKRFSHGLQAGGAFTWGKGFQTPTNPQDFFNHNAESWDLQQIPPRILTFNFTYTVPKASFLPKFANTFISDWQVGGYANYQSGAFLAPPTSQTANFLSSIDERVAGQPLYTQGVDPNNLSTYSPYYTQVLNPAAWKACPSNTTCAAPGVLYSDFRAPRTPVENANIARNFRIKERMNFYIRAEFVNIFNRTIMPAPTTNGFFGVDPSIPAQKNAQGIYTGGFGVINAYATPNTAPGSGAPYLTGRTGTLIARFTF